jgi:Bacterial TSP3 repeat
MVMMNGTVTYRDTLNAAFLTFTTNLPAGLYRAVISPPLADLSGNQITQPFRWNFWALGTRDSDQDGLPDNVEIALGLDPNNPDTNGNGILDGDEDLEGDGLSNKWELRYGYDPILSDTDGNGVADGEEDPDFDKLNNRSEFAYGLNPENADSDGDGWDDATEILDGTDPLDPTSGAKTTLASSQASYFNGLLEMPPTNVVWSAFSPAVAFFNGLSVPGPTNAFIVSPIVSYENQ